MVGSGAWACAAVRMVAQSTAEAAKSPASCFVPEVTMWVHEEKHSGRNLTEVRVRGRVRACARMPM
jgi:glycerol-3-phosphate dehydrogenase (NAD+)